MAIDNKSNLSYEAYLFVYFTGESEEGEQVYFSLSRDGLYWNDLNNGQPVLKSQIGEKEFEIPLLFAPR